MFPLVRGWIDVDRTTQANTRLGATLSFVAGAANAGGFLAVGQYTSHMTGVVSSIADHLVLGNITLALAALGTLMAFVFGAMTTAWIVNCGLPLLLEAVALLLFGLFGAAIKLLAVVFVPLTVLLLCFIMGLQNAVITKISKSEIRTTHVTGLVTDLGIELGKLVYINYADADHKVFAKRDKLRMHGTLILCFFPGGVIGALGFKHLGYVSSLPLSLILLVLVIRPIQQDMQELLERRP
jgi:uncharacterized membrane protein YoaK (UPF0700 family)